MNGLEAIKVMMEGKVVTDGEYLYKEIDGDICFKGKHASEYAVDNEFNFASDYKECLEPKLIGWEHIAEEEDVYFEISPVGTVADASKYFGASYIQCYKVANAFSTKKKADEINFKQTLFRKLQRFSDENDGNEIDWSNDAWKWHIYFNYMTGDLEAECTHTYRAFGQVYFLSKDAAEQAIELFRKDLIKYFTHDWSGANE